MTGSTQSQKSILRGVQEAGRHRNDGSLALLAGYLNHPDPEVRAEVIESLGRLDTAEAHQWIVALASLEPNDRVRHSICRAARYWTLTPVARVIEEWVRGRESSETLRNEGLAALIEMQAKESLARLRAEIGATWQPTVLTSVDGVLASVTVVRGDRDILSREANTPLWTWKLWHVDGTVTQLLDDGNVLGPDFREYDPWTSDCWPPDAPRRGRLSLRRDILALIDGEPGSVRKLLEAGLVTPAAAGILHTAMPWIDDADDLLSPHLEHRDVHLRASVWAAVASFGSIALRGVAVDSLARESEPSVRHMMLVALRKNYSEAAGRLLRQSLATDDDVERAVACYVASFANATDLVAMLRKVAQEDPSAVCRGTAIRAIARSEARVP